MGSGEESRLGDSVCLMILDRFTGWMGSYPARNKSAEEVVTAFEAFLGTGNPRVKRVYTDGSKEFERAFKDLHLSHDVSVAYDPQSNGVAENSIRRMKEGTRCALVQSGLAPEWWAEAARAFAIYRNTTDLYQGQTPYERRHGRKYDGPKIPFGSAVRFLPSGPLAERNHVFQSKTRMGIYLGPVLNSNNEYKGLSNVIDAESLSEAYRPNEVHIITLNSKEVILSLIHI